ncbi:MAG TPA: metallophosphoesterase family protein [Gammaproteobacteria bacterium]|nr:metallophosphoesterase family protein [Gammaproteobacteria bacterium]
MTAIGLISDVHARVAPVREALEIFAREGVQQVFCAGDIAGYHHELAETVALLADSGVQAVCGNHDLHYPDKPDTDAGTLAYLGRLPTVIDTVIEGKRVYIVHAEPPDACMGGGIRLLDKFGAVRRDRAGYWTGQLADFGCDVLVIGHTHQVFAERLGATLVVNPGSTAFNHSCAVLRLPEARVEIFPLSGRSVEPYWSWSEYMRSKTG